MSDSQYYINTNQWGYDLTVLSVSQIKRDDKVYFVIRFRNSNDVIYERFIDISVNRYSPNMRYHTQMSAIPHELDYDTKCETIRKSDEKFIPESYVPGDEIKTWIINSAAQFHITQANYKPETGKNGGYVTFRVCKQNATTGFGSDKPTVLIWELTVECEHNGKRQHEIQMDSVRDGHTDFGPTFTI